MSTGSSDDADQGARVGARRKADRGGVAGKSFAALLVVAGFGAGVVLLGPSDDSRGTGGGGGGGVSKVLGLEPQRPLPTVDPPTGGGAHAFMQTTADGEPVGFDPCTTIALRMNPTRAPDGAQDLIEAAAARLSQASGIPLRIGEPTDERPILGSIGNLQEQDATAPDGDPEIVVIWSRPKETTVLRKRTVGVGGSTAYATGDSRPYYLRGAVALDTRPLREALLRGDGRRRVIAVVMHELAHALGLDHVEKDGELMNARSLGRLELGPGDRTGLARVGAIPCA